jgi:hypothetical protein
MKKIVFATLVSALLLFVWSGVTQMLPWGVPTAQNITVQTSESEQNSSIPNLVQLPAGSLTTVEFDAQFINKISTYTTNDTFSWIVTQPVQNNYTGYFVGEFITHLIFSIFLSILLLLTVQLDLRTRMVIVAVAGLAAVSATYGQMMNWWRLPAIYAVGVSFNVMVGWTLASFLSARFIIKSKGESIL